MEDNKMVELLKSRFHIEAERNDQALLDSYNSKEL